jgi:hypothetical protein
MAQRTRDSTQVPKNTNGQGKISHDGISLSQNVTIATFYRIKLLRSQQNSSSFQHYSLFFQHQPFLPKGLKPFGVSSGHARRGW